MGDLQPDNGGGVPPEDGAYGDRLPELPPEWGRIVIPDDPAALADEANVVRRELRRQVWRTRLRGMVGLGPGRRDTHSFGVPIVIMAVAVITTLLSLFVVTWDQQRSATAPVGPDAALQQAEQPLADITLTDASGSRVRLGDVLPAMLLMVEDCDCAELINDIAAVTPKPVLIVPVSAEAACAAGSTKNVWCLADPAGIVTGRYPPPTTAPATELAGPTATATASPGATASGPSASGPSASGPSASGPSASRPSASPRPEPVATAVPVDEHGVAHEPIIVTRPDDLTEALARLSTGQ